MVKAIGRSVGATCNLRTRYCKVTRREREAPRPKRALRNHAKATLERETQILDEVLEGALRGGVVVVPPLKEKIKERLGKPVALSTIYRILARNGWPSWRRTQQYIYAYGAVSPQDSCFDSLDAFENSPSRVKSITGWD